MPTILFALFACTSSLVLESPEDGTHEGSIDADDTGFADDTGLDTGSADDTGDTGDTAEPEPEPEPEADYTIWNGTREMTVDGCTQYIYENGYALESDWSMDIYGEVITYQDAVDACPACDHFYYVTATTDDSCGVDIYDEFYRGLDLDDGSAKIYVMDADWDWDGVGVAANALDEGAGFDGWTIDYTYSSESWWTLYEYVGWVEFPEAP